MTARRFVGKSVTLMKELAHCMRVRSARVVVSDLEMIEMSLML